MKNSKRWNGRTVVVVNAVTVKSGGRGKAVEEAGFLKKRGSYYYVLQFDEKKINPFQIIHFHLLRFSCSYSSNYIKLLVHPSYVCLLYLKFERKDEIFQL